MSSGTKLQRLFNAFTSRVQHSRRNGRGRLFRPEQLETRTLLTAYTVTNLNDDGAGSLRDALNQANSNSGADTISFGSSLTGTIALTSGHLQISDSVTITGRGADLISVSGGNQAFIVFNIDDGTNTLKDVTITGLTIRDGGDGSTFMNGAGIFSRENLTLDNVALLDNDSGPDGGGGGLEMFAGTLKMSNSIVAGNKSRQGGGIELASDTVAGVIVNSTISGNESKTYGGGLIALSGDVVVRNSTITGNRSDSNGSGAEFGGGVFGNVGLLTLHNTIVAGNFRGTGTTADDVGNPLVAESSHNLIGNLNTAGELQHNVNGNLLGNNGSGIRPIATILNTTRASNGGPTQTHALVTGSVAINAGSNALALDVNGVALTRDQRGGQNPRIFGTVDIGAFELISVSGPIVVDTSVDENDNNLATGDVSLREAIVLANLIPGANTITFAATTDGQPINLSLLGGMQIAETLTITGNGAANTIVDGQQRGTGILSITAGDVTLNSMTLRNGTASIGGGAIRSTTTGTLTISQSTLSGNSNSNSNSNGNGNGSRGGAIYTNAGAVTISQSTLSGNSSSDSSGSSGGRGGAIYTNAGAVTISQSTLSGNSITSSSSIWGSAGGAIFAGFGAVTISQSTLSGNSITSSSTSNSIGGAIYAGVGAVTVRQSTLSGNSIISSSGNISPGGAIFSGTLGPKTIHNSIVAGNTATEGADLFFVHRGVIVTNSLIGRSDGTSLTPTSGTTPDANGNFIGGTTDASKIAPLLGPLDDNGGPTKTHALLAGSLAVNRGNNSLAVDITNGNVALTTDQRGVGFSRILFTTVDIGAFESSEIYPIDGTAGSDSFVVTYSSTTTTGFFTVTRSTNSGPVSNLGTFPMSFSLTLNGLGGTDSVRVVGTGSNDSFTVANNLVTTNGSRLTLSSIENRTLAGGAGGDVYKFDADVALGAYTLDESVGGADTIDFSLTSTVGVTLNMGNAAQQAVHATNLQLTLGSGTPFENAIGGAGADTLRGNNLNNTLTGNSGNDTLIGGVGSDILNGGRNDDTYHFGPATSRESDQVNENLNEGVDTLIFASVTTNVILNLGVVTGQNVHTNRALRLNQLASFENVVGGSGADRLTGNILHNTLTGNAGNDILNGAAGNDILNGGLNNDTYQFSVASSRESDEVNEFGNQGTDTLSFSTLTNGVTLNLGSIAVQSVHTNRALTLNSTGTFENITGGSSHDLLIGNALNNVLLGGNGNNILIGNDGNDSLFGGTGRDILIGGFGADLLDGRANEDILIAGWRTVDARMNSNDITNIRSVLSEWTSVRTVANRIAHLRAGSGGVNLISIAAGSDVRNDLSVDTLTGGSETDWYFLTLSSVNHDKITDPTLDDFFESLP